MQRIKVLWPDPADHVPSLKTEYIDIHGILDASLKLIAPQEWVDGKPEAPPSSNLLFNSVHGLGKTLLAATLVLKLSERLGKKVPMIVYDCSEDTRDYHLKGSFTMQPDGSTAFIPGPFPSAIHLANEVGCCVLCAEEISALTPGAQKQFNAMTDWRDGIYVPQTGEYYKVKSGCRVITLATMNPSVYSGVYSLNSDLRSRFDECEVPYPTQEQEERILKSVCPKVEPGMIEKACQVAKDTRPGGNGKQTFDYQLSTRDLVKLVENIYKMGGDTEIPLTYVANKFEGEDRITVIDRINGAFNTSIGGRTKPAPMAGGWGQRA